MLNTTAYSQQLAYDLPPRRGCLPFSTLTRRTIHRGPSATLGERLLLSSCPAFDQRFLVPFSRGTFLFGEKGLKLLAGIIGLASCLPVTSHKLPLRCVIGVLYSRSQQAKGLLPTRILCCHEGGREP